MDEEEVAVDAATVAKKGICLGTVTSLRIWTMLLAIIATRLAIGAGTVPCPRIVSAILAYYQCDIINRVDRE